MLEHVHVPGFLPPRIGEPARFRLVHHAEVIALKGDSYRIKDRDLGRVPGLSAGRYAR
jgi:hypothetical protein